MRGGEEHAQFLALLDSERCVSMGSVLRERLIALHFASNHNAYQQGHRDGRLVEKKKDANI